MDSAISVALASAVGVIGASGLQVWNNVVTTRAGERREALLRKDQETRWESERSTAESARRLEVEQAAIIRQNEAEEMRRSAKMVALLDFVKIAQVCYGNLYACFIAKGDPLTNSNLPVQAKQMNLLNESLGALSLHTGEQQLLLAREVVKLIIAMNAKAAIDDWRQDEAEQRLLDMETKLGQMSGFLI